MVSFLVAGWFLFISPVYAEDATVELKIVPSGCQVSQVVENGEVKDSFTPTGCDAPPESVKPDVSQKNTQTSNIPAQQKNQSTFTLTPFLISPSTVQGSVPNANQRSRTASDEVSALPTNHSAVAIIAIVAMMLIVVAMSGVIAGWGLQGDTRTHSGPRKKK